ncbi:MAG: aminotransferase class V-fold PLP-dependent enzyme, partial [Chloroflexota bacterium]
MNNLEDQFLLDPDVVFLNHGSFGATPRPVFEVYQEWQRRLERQPVRFLVNELPDHLAAARQSLGNYINAGTDDVVYVPNATFALNVVARSLDLGPDDEVLTTDHEYGACDNVWTFLSRKRGFQYRRQPISFPIESRAALVSQLWQGVTRRTRVIYLSHLTSSTALSMPVTEICRLAADKGILTVIDGAHAPGQIPVDMQAIGADFYFGNAHKWLCSPKGAGFLFTRPEKQSLIEPLVVGWGWGEERTFTYGSDYLDYLQWLGTNDLAAYLSVPAAIQFQEENDWPAVRHACHNLLREAIDRIVELTGIGQCYPDSSHYAQMAVARLPAQSDLPGFKDRLYDDFRIEVPCIEWQDRQ